MPNFTTGPATLPDVGTLSYNGCVFSPLFETSISGRVIKDNANRTTKFMEYSITVDGYVTLPDNALDIDPVMGGLRDRLTAQAGILIYSGRGMNITVNSPGGLSKDVAWGPIPEILDFQPMGAGRSAKIRWMVKTRIPEVASFGTGSVLQFNDETGVTYDEAGYSTLSIRGTLEIPLTRATQSTRTLTQTVDNFRNRFMDSVGQGIDLTKFRVVRRDFQISRDKRTMEWDFAAEELPYMGLPANVTLARGSFNFRPNRSGMGLCQWLCTLRGTYTVRKDMPRRLAWLAFLALLRERMAASVYAVVPSVSATANQNPSTLSLIAQNTPFTALGAINLSLAPARFAASVLPQQNRPIQAARKAWLIDVSGDEGIYLDSKEMTFSATWRLVTTLSGILVASGLWRKVPQDGGNIWATSVRGISGANSWLINRLDPAGDAIVDFGG